MLGSRPFKEVFYENYRTTHNLHLYGETSLAAIRKKFPVWSYYYKSHLPKDRNATVLEIGCGDGAFLFFLHELGYRNAGGVDYSAEQISAGESLGIRNMTVGDAKAVLASAGSAKYDLIIARDVLEHFARQDAYELLCLVCRSLRPGGKFIMQVPNGEGMFYTSIFFGDYTHEMAYTQSSVRQLFLNAGFKNSYCHPTGPVPYTLLGAIRKAFWGLRVFVHRFWKMVETGNSSGIFTSNLIAVGIK